jgi:uncharacterized membrane protein YvlD (DUF360 family)
MIKGLVRSVLINTLVLVIIALRIPFGWMHITPLTWNAAPYLLLMGFIFWAIFHVARPILGFLTTPINWFTLGLAGILLNMIALYAFMYIVNYLGFGVNVQLGSVEQTFILSIIVSVLTLVLKKGL